MSETKKRTYTPQQEAAISARGGSVLVSAAAGSGKTSVLTERVVRLITDEKKPVRADRLLIVTFTKAAAAEMKSRITEQIRERLNNDPQNANLKRQILLLQNADICTIDSFCSKIVQDNFFDLGVKRDLRIGTESELAIVRQDALDETLEELYQEIIGSGETDFSALADALSTDKSDYNLGKVIISIYEKILSHPFPLKWLEKAVKMYESDFPFEETEWGKTALSNLKYSVSYMKKISGTIVKRIKDRIEELETDVSAILSGAKKPSKEEQKIIKCKDNLVGKLTPFLQYRDLSIKLEKTEKWDEVVLAVTEFFPDPPTRTRLLPEDSDLSEYISNSRNELNETFDGIKKIFSRSSGECSEEQRTSAALARGLYKAVSRFDEKFTAAKNDKGIADFSDLEHLTLKLLIKENGDKFERTPQSYEIAEKYDEIIVDEYQDTNMVQDMIFMSVSQNGENLFTVGDVKQSIYRFREAMPDIFLNRRKKYAENNRDNSDNTCHAPIFLSGNFRSSKGIIDSVNFIFSQIMSERVGEVVYDDEEKLIACAEYPDISEPETELHIVTSKKQYSWCEDEAKHIADIVENTVGKLMVKDGNGTRAAEYGDICILMRNPKEFIEAFIRIFDERGIPVSRGKGENLFDRTEIKLLLAFLSAVDNPKKDIPLVSIMMSPVYGFTPDDMSKLRLSSRYKKIYASLCSYAFSKDADDDGLKEKCNSFINELSYYRKLSSTMPSDSFLEVFFARSGFLSVVGAEKDGEARVKNVRKILSLAREYEKNGFKGLSGFIRMLERLKETGSELMAAAPKSDNDVKIMSIHGSKGLEFPVCILATTSAPRKSDMDTVAYHPRLGIAFKSYDREKMVTGNTEIRTIVTYEKKCESISEEMRILYVALTRAKEKLYLVNTFYVSKTTAFEKRMAVIKAKLPLDGDNKIEPSAVESCTSFSQWLLMCALRHPSLLELRRESCCDYIGIIPSSSVWKYVHADIDDEETTEEISTNIVNEGQVDEALKEKIIRNLQFSYSQKELVSLPTKISASGLSHESGKTQFIVKTMPKFMNGTKLMGASRGTAFHEFLHYGNIFTDSFDFESELALLRENGFLSSEQTEAIEKEAVLKFFESDLFKRMKAADKIMREYRFTVTIPAHLVDESISEKNAKVPILMQGAIDCVFIENGKAVIVDYKTDKIKDIAVLADNYSKQLMLYKDAFERTSGIPVSECILYSLEIGEEIKI